jgi:hypothetical protein
MGTVLLAGHLRTVDFGEHLGVSAPTIEEAEAQAERDRAARVERRKGQLEAWG